MSAATGEMEQAKAAAQMAGLAEANIDNEVARGIVDCIGRMKSHIDNTRALTAAATSYFVERTSDLHELQGVAAETENHIASAARPQSDVGHSLPVAFFIGQSVQSITDNYMKLL